MTSVNTRDIINIQDLILNNTKDTPDTKNTPDTKVETENTPDTKVETNETQDATSSLGLSGNTFNSSQGIKKTYTPNSEGKTNTGQGAEAALGTDFSWNKAGKEKAQTQFESDVVNAKTNAQQNATTINQQLVQNQEAADMIQYKNNQEAEKVGWTGGYVLDQNRQAEYLKASINAQMYGAIELQKYGYDTSLAAARLSYDLNQQAFAKEYYNEAVQNALNEAQITGVYFSAETKDMMAQYNIAKQKLKENPSDESAANITKSIDNWFESNGISPEGVKTLAAWQADQANELNWQNEIWTEYQAALQTAQAAIDENATAFIAYNADGIEYNNGEVRIIDFNGLSNKQLSEYASLSDKGREQVQAYIEYKKQEIYSSNAIVDSDGNPNGYRADNIDKELKALEQQVQEINNASKEINNASDDSIKDIKIDISDKPTAQGGTQSTNEYTFRIGETEYTGTVDKIIGVAPKDKTFNANYNGTSMASGASFTSSFKCNNNEGVEETHNISTTSAKVIKVDDPNEKNVDQDDIAVTIYTSDGTKTGTGYNIEVANNGKVMSTVNKNCSDYVTAWYETVTGGLPIAGAIISLDGVAWFYNENGTKGPYHKLTTGWYPISGQGSKGSTTNNKLLEELNKLGQYK